MPLFQSPSRGGRAVTEMCGSQVCPQWLWVSHINILTVVFISGSVQERVTPQRQTALRETPRRTQMGSEGEKWNWRIMETCVWNIKRVFRPALEHLRQSHCSLSEELIINEITVWMRENLRKYWQGLRFQWHALENCIKCNFQGASLYILSALM